MTSVAGAHTSQWWIHSMSALQFSSPLERFKVAKEHVTGLFRNLIFVTDSAYTRVFRQVEKESNTSNKDLRVVVRKLGERIETDRLKLQNASEKLATNKMKIAFFGRTSNGKSSVINAMLGRHILPAGIGHTTSCFCYLQGTSETSAFLELPHSNTRHVETVQELAHSLSHDKLDSSALVKVFWPHQEYALLKNEVVLVDSPGFDVSPDTDVWISEHCKEADVFVLVANAESTLMQTEKRFFHKLAEMSSKPNIFILNNRWDSSAADPEYMDEVRQQHLDCNLQFLCEELKVFSRQEGLDHVFFVSAKETLFIRTHPRETDVDGLLPQGFRERLAEFEAFENAIEECTSSHAIQTKFGEPARAALSIASNLHASLCAFQEDLKCIKQERESELAQCRERIVVLRRDADVCLAFWARKIEEIRTQSQKQVTKGVTDEIHRLNHAIKEYETSVIFSVDKLDVYKKELCENLSSRLGQHLFSSCLQKLSEDCIHVQQLMFDELQRIFPPSIPLPAASTFVRPNFHISHEMDVASLCSDFEADLTFHFRLGWSSLINWLSTGKHGRSPVPGLPAVMHRTSSTGSGDDLDSWHGSGQQIHSTLPLSPASAASVQQSAQMAAQVVGRAPWLIIGAGLIVWKTVGWKVIAGSLGLYSLLYSYERLCWTNRAKEEVFKEQMATFASEKLRVVMTFISSSCSSQVKQQLSSCKEQLCGELNTAQASLQRERVLLEHDIAQLVRLEHDAHEQTNLADLARTDFNTFLSELDLSRSSANDEL